MPWRRTRSGSEEGRAGWLFFDLLCKLVCRVGARPRKTQGICYAKWYALHEGVTDACMHNKVRLGLEFGALDLFRISVFGFRAFFIDAEEGRRIQAVGAAAARIAACRIRSPDVPA
jgi:hypothetical protein